MTTASTRPNSITPWYPPRRRCTYLVRYHVLFVLELSTRAVEIAGIVPEPDGQWVEQVARNLTDVFDGFLRGKRYLIHDRSPLFTNNFAEILKEAGVMVMKLPPRSPNLNPHAEPFVSAIEQFIAHYHVERNHQGLGNQLIVGEEPVGKTDGQICCCERLGGLLRYYHRAA